MACVCMCVCVLAVAGAAYGRAHAVLRWPNSPVQHPIGRATPRTLPTFSANLRGDVAVTGNTVETCPENVAPGKTRAKRPRHTRGTPRDSTACINANNNDHNMIYVNVDPSNGHFDSSSATLSVPAGAQVKQAYLYWGADLSEGVNRPPNDPRPFPAGNAAPDGRDPGDRELVPAGR